jgi:hypothetical protein
MKPMQQPTSIWILLASVAGVAAVATAVATQPGCSGAACVGVGDPDEPSATIECPAGLLCYRGQCQLGCNAGTELQAACETSDDCDSSRPNCVNKFCSVCPEGEQCIPTLNICRRIDPVSGEMTPDPERPGPTTPKPTYALDASFEPQGLKPGSDAGQEVIPVDIPYTHVVFIDIAQEEDWRVAGHPERGVFAINAWDVTTTPVINVRWRGDHSPLSYERGDNGGAITEQDCAYRTLISVPSAVPVDFGDVRIDDNDTEDGQLPFIGPAMLKYTAAYAAGAYSVTPSVPSQFLNLSQPRPADLSGPSLVSLFTVTGLGSDYTGDASWPFSSESTIPVPFELVPAAMPGEVDLNVPQTLLTPAQDLIFRWNAVATGVTDSMRVRVRIPFGEREIFCELVESRNNNNIVDTIPVAASLLEQFRTDVGAGTVVPIYFERTQRAGLYAPGPVSEAGTSAYSHSVTLWSRHTLVGSLRL